MQQKVSETNTFWKKKSEKKNSMKKYQRKLLSSHSTIEDLKLTNIMQKTTSWVLKHKATTYIAKK